MAGTERRLKEVMLAGGVEVTRGPDWPRWARVKRK
jgi:hypothetical protein